MWWLSLKVTEQDSFSFECNFALRSSVEEKSPTQEISFTKRMRWNRDFFSIPYLWPRWTRPSRFVTTPALEILRQLLIAFWIQLLLLAVVVVLCRWFGVLNSWIQTLNSPDIADFIIIRAAVPCHCSPPCYLFMRCDDTPHCAVCD